MGAVRFDFVKCHGSGNDFPLIDARALSLSDAEWAAVARALADRRGPVGGDGLLLLGQGIGDAAFSMRMFNSDGSEAETCLNGLRCVARAGFEALGIDAADVSLKTSTAYVERDADVAPGVYTVRETAGPAGLDAAAWPLTGAGPRIVEAAVPPLGSARLFTAVSMPNPHLVTFVDAVDEAELVAVGERCEAAPAWLPNRANVSFVEVRGGDLFVRTFERGVGLTDSCGSAMAASSFAACLTGRLAYGAPITVFNKGGLVRAVVAENAMVSLSGNATWEWRGSVDVDLATEQAGSLRVEGHADAEIAAWAQLADAASR
ncbi:diaminopimelate epimerase [Arthrobacter sp. TPD3018]|uniref:diaminopimelate epimerase n=1 Tax=Bacteria TaxID=2 RepID=UPI000D516FFF|nr:MULTISPECIES: diaminopimelate epimerase [Bacteria]PVE59295.1 diaminopimelate epimerase [Sphingomonas sp. TPD3009]PVE60818.1 diaminopimelate epimerase [Arthrobacter sp. TPD3018]PVE87495.1 diaminopimelate epimerase [Sphingomonas melonis]